MSAPVMAVLVMLAVVAVAAVIPVTVAYQKMVQIRRIMRAAVREAGRARALADAERQSMMAAKAHYDACAPPRRDDGVDVRLAGRDPAARPGAPEPELTRPGRAGRPFPGHPGYVLGMCGHLLSRSEWTAGFTACQRCDTDEILGRPPVPLHPVPSAGPR